MKKLLGAILIIAALAGLYIGAANIRAVIAERAILEKEYDERSARLESTAGMLKKLDSDRDEYLDCLKDVSEGEEDIVDGEDKLADAETEYADAAAKLADARKGLAGLDDSVRALTAIKKGYEKQWHPGFAARISDKELAKLMTGRKIKKQPGLAQSREMITQSLTGEDGTATLMMVEMLSGEKNLSQSISNADTYPEFDRALKKLIKAFKGAKKAAIEISEAYEKYASDNDSDEPDDTDEITALIEAMTGKSIEEVSEADIKKSVSTLTKGLDSSIEMFDGWRKGYKLLKKSSDKLADSKKGIPYAFRRMLANSMVSAYLDNNTISVMKKFSGNRLEKDDLDEFDRDMKKVSAALGKIISGLRAARNKGQKAYSQGLKAYREAPGQLEEGREKIIEGRAALAAGNALIEDYEARQELAAKELFDLTGAGAASDKEGLMDTEKGLAAITDEKSAMKDKKEADSRALDRDMAAAAAVVCASMLMLITGTILILNGKKHRR